MKYLKLFLLAFSMLILSCNVYSISNNYCDSGYVKVKNVDIFYKIYGEGKPVVMLHGFSIDHRIMEGAMEPIFKKTKGYKRIYFDLPGMGKTKNYESIQNADQVLQLIFEFIDLKIPNQNFILTGLSYGGYLSRGIINKRPELVDGLILICPVGETERSKRELPEHQIIVQNNKFASTLSDKEINTLKSLFVVQDKWMWDRFQTEIAPSIILGDNEYLEKYQQNNYSFSFEVDELGEPFKKPALFLCGKQDAIVGYQDIWDILPFYPRATYAVLDVAGHCLNIEQEELFNSLVNEFLRRTQMITTK